MDIRINTTFRDHRKRKRLIRKLGHVGVVALIDLWLFTADNNPDGDLKDYGIEDVSDDAGWDGDPDEFVNALMDTGFLVKYENGYCLHGWDEHQQWVIGSEMRRQKARHAAKMRWGNLASDNTTSIAPSMPQALPDSDLAMLNDARGNAPNQSPDHIPNLTNNHNPNAQDACPSFESSWKPDKLTIEALMMGIKSRYNRTMPDMSGYIAVLRSKRDEYEQFDIERLCGWLGDRDWTGDNGKYTAGFGTPPDLSRSWEKLMGSMNADQKEPELSPELQEIVKKARGW